MAGAERVERGEDRVGRGSKRLDARAGVGLGRRCGRSCGGSGLGSKVADRGVERTLGERRDTHCATREACERHGGWKGESGGETGKKRIYKNEKRTAIYKCRVQSEWSGSRPKEDGECVWCVCLDVCLDDSSDNDNDNAKVVSGGER